MDAAKKEHELIVSVSPHIRSTETVPKIMWTVSAALLPALGVGVYVFGPGALVVTAICIAASLASEAFMLKMTGREVCMRDGSAFLTGLLLGMNLPPTVPIYIPIVGSFVAVAITKQLFGGLGFNIFNPALIGRAFVLITWPRAMTTWAIPKVGPTASAATVDVTTMATPLGIMKEESYHALVQAYGGSTDSLYQALAFGFRGGSLGEVSAVAILLGGVFLLAKRYITWHIPVSFMATVALLAWIFGGENEAGTFIWIAGDPVVHLLSGGLMLGALFMATDYVTAPSHRSGQLIFGIGCGAITMLIRLKGGFPEGVMFAILLMNCFAPLIDRKFRPRTFGQRQKEKAA